MYRQTTSKRKGYYIVALPRMRTLDECYKELKQVDKNTAVSKNFIRNLALSGSIPVVMCGNKRLINFDGLLDYLNNPAQRKKNTPCSGLKRII